MIAGRAGEGVCAIVVSRNTKAALRECLTALTARDAADSVQTICIDNGSTDSSVDLVRREFPSVDLVTNQENVGFARACNQGIVLAVDKYAAAYVALVNSDVVVGPAAIFALVAEMADRPEVAVVGPALRLPDGRLETGAAGFAPTAWSGVCYFLCLSALAPRWCRGFVIDQRQFVGRLQPVPVDWVSGVCMVARAAAIGRVGYLDSRFFTYGGDVEWCQRMRRSSFSVCYVAQVQVVHHHGASGSHTEWLASACELVRRERGQLEYLVFRTAAAVGLGARRIIYALAFIASREEHYRRLARDMSVCARWALGLG